MISYIWSTLMLIWLIMWYNNVHFHCHSQHNIQYMWIRLFEMYFQILLTIVLLKIQEKKSHWFLFYSPDSSLCSFSIKVLRSSALRLKRIWSSFHIFWLNMSQINHNILVKFTNNSNILIWYIITKNLHSSWLCMCPIMPTRIVVH